MTDDTGWLVRTYGQIGGAPPVLLAGGSLRFDGAEGHLEMEGVSGKGRIVIGNDGAFLGVAGRQGREWWDFTNPAVTGGGMWRLTTRRPELRVRTRRVRGERLDVSTELVGVALDEDVLAAQVREVWSAGGGEVRRMVVRTSIHSRTGDGAEPLLTYVVYDRADAIRPPSYYGWGDVVVPATAALRYATERPRRQTPAEPSPSRSAGAAAARPSSTPAAQRAVWRPAVDVSSADAALERRQGPRTTFVQDRPREPDWQPLYPPSGVGSSGGQGEFEWRYLDEDRAGDPVPPAVAPAQSGRAERRRAPGVDPDDPRWRPVDGPPDCLARFRDDGLVEFECDGVRYVPPSGDVPDPVQDEPPVFVVTDDERAAAEEFDRTLAQLLADCGLAGSTALSVRKAYEAADELSKAYIEALKLGRKPTWKTIDDTRALLVASSAFLIAMIDCYASAIEVASYVGEPHITTLDGHKYDLQALGEFVFLSSDAFEVQARFDGEKGKATYATATAVRAGGHVIEVFFDRSGPGPQGVPVVVDGEEIEVDHEGLLHDDGTFVARRSGGERDRNVLVVDAQGNYVLIENLANSQEVHMGLSPTARAGGIGGLIGVPDGNPSNDFTLRDGTRLTFAQARTIQGLYGRFAGDWRVRLDERLFTRGDARRFRTDRFTALPERLRGLSNFTPEQQRRAREQCRHAGVQPGPALEDCAYDLLATGDDGWVDQSATSQRARGEVLAQPEEREQGTATPDHPLLIASDGGAVGDILQLLDDGTDPNVRRADDGWTPLMFAAQQGCATGVKPLVDAGARPDDRASDGGVTPLYLASQNGEEQAVQALLDARADPGLARDDGATPLLAAAFAGHSDVVRALLTAGASVNAGRTEDGFTPLLAAAQEDYASIASVLLGAGADPRRTDAEGRSALGIAAYRGYVEIAERLLRANADPNQQRAGDGVSPLHFAAQEGQPALVRLLLRAGANPNIRREDGVTALHVAAYNDDPEIVGLLIAAGADPRARDDQGRTAEDVAGRQARKQLP